MVDRSVCVYRGTVPSPKGSEGAAQGAADCATWGATGTAAGTTQGATARMPVPARFAFEVVPESCTALDVAHAVGFSKRTLGQLFEGGHAFVADHDPDQARSEAQASSQMPRVARTTQLHAGDVLVFEDFCTRDRDARDHAPLSREPQNRKSPNTDQGRREPPDLPAVLYEDPFLVAVDKPQGILVHADGTSETTLTDHVQRYVDLHGTGALVQPVQRLDVDTSGIVAFSVTELFQSLFDQMVADGGMTKRYLAVVDGRYPHAEDVLSDPIGRDRHDARRMRVSPTGQECKTYVTRLAYDSTADKTLLEVRLGTGRQHQIRVHLSYHGHPVCNDPLYGSPNARGGTLMLHAWRLQFAHPVTDASVSIETPVPPRMGPWSARLLGTA